MPWGMIAAQHVRACMLRTPEPRIAVVATGVACIRTLDPLHNFPASHATALESGFLMICTAFWYCTKNPHSPRSPPPIFFKLY